MAKKKDQVLVIRLSEELKDKLEKLSENKKFDGNNSALIRYLIELEYKKKL